MVRSRILQIVINSLLFALLAIAVVDLAVETRWQLEGGDVRVLAAILVSVACLAALAGSIGLNLQILRGSRFVNLPSRSLLPYLYSITFAIVLVYIAVERPSIASLNYDSHLSTLYMAVEAPNWQWLQFTPINGIFMFHDYQILNLLAYLVLTSFLLMTKYVGRATDNSNISYSKLNSTLIKYQIALGVIFLLLAVMCVFAFIENLTAFGAMLEFDPDMKNLSNLAGFGLQLMNSVLLLVYGRLILRDGLILRTNEINSPTP